MYNVFVCFMMDLKLRSASSSARPALLSTARVTHALSTAPAMGYLGVHIRSGRKMQGGLNFS
jgi:hypothetical protein